MTTPDITAAARLIATLLAHRPTAADEVPGLIRTVHGALARLGQEEIPEPAPPVVMRVQRIAPAAPRRPRVKRAAPEAFEPVEPAAPPPAPKLVRRAEVAAAPQTPPSLAPTNGSTVRGIVKWFDPRTGKGALRLPGFSGDVALDARLLTESGITRLFKGQEVEAMLAEGTGAPQLQHLALPGTVAASPLGGGGMVRSRRAKPVLVELKRESLRRAAARAEAEHLLGPNRPR
jgi:cold shock CspA family protein